MRVHFSQETELLDTGGGIRRVASFLRESDPCVIVGGDMIVDCDLPGLIERHRTRGDAFTLLLRDDPRARRFGTVGLDAAGSVRRIGHRFDLGGETACGVYTWVNVVSARALDTLPDRERFSHFDGWLTRLLARGDRDIRGEVASRDACTWEPVGTPSEYLAVNLHPPALRYFDADRVARAAGARFETDLVIGAGATIEPGASLRRAVVWEDETVSAVTKASDGVFAGGRFVPCSESGGEAGTL
jgi:NDP-sugar pyrophosphorylase family protein